MAQLSHKEEEVHLYFLIVGNLEFTFRWLRIYNPIFQIQIYSSTSTDHHSIVNRNKDSLSKSPGSGGGNKIPADL